MNYTLLNNINVTWITRAHEFPILMPHSNLCTRVGFTKLKYNVTLFHWISSWYGSSLPSPSADVTSIKIVGFGEGDNSSKLASISSLLDDVLGLTTTLAKLRTRCRTLPQLRSIRNSLSPKPQNPWKKIFSKSCQNRAPNQDEFKLHYFTFVDSGVACHTSTCVLMSPKLMDSQKVLFDKWCVLPSDISNTESFHAFPSLCFIGIVLPFPVIRHVGLDVIFLEKGRIIIFWLAHAVILYGSVAKMFCMTNKATVDMAYYLQVSLQQPAGGIYAKVFKWFTVTHALHILIQKNNNTKVSKNVVV